jgi:hypothetical protein
VCCGAQLGGLSELQCELYVGHEDQHATLVRREGGRTLRRWASPVRVVDIDFSAGVAAGLPWAPGHPAATAASSTESTRTRPDRATPPSGATQIRDRSRVSASNASIMPIDRVGRSSAAAAR